MAGKFATQAAAIQREQWEQYPDIMRYIYGSPPERAAPERSGATGHNQTLTEPQKCGIIKAIRRHLRRWKRKQEEKKVKKYIVREYKTAPDGSEYETERYTITADELDETREGLDELTGTAIDRYEIEEQ